jgi:hypothetical protein
MCVLILLYLSSYYCIFVLILLCVLILIYIYVLILLYVSSSCVLMRVKRPTNAYVLHAWVLRQVGDVCAVVQFGNLDGHHLSMMLSLVSTDPALS